MKTLKSVGFLLGLPIILLLWWWLATSGAPNFFVPTRAKLLTTFVETWIGERLITDVLPSIMRLVVGVLAAIVLGIVLGLAVGLNRTMRAVTEPVFEFFRALPPPVLVPVLMEKASGS